MGLSSTWFVAQNVIHDEVSLIVYHLYRGWSPLHTGRELIRREISRFKEADVKDIMAFHVMRKLESVSHRRDHVADLERSSYFWAQFGCRAFMEVQR